MLWLMPEMTIELFYTMEFYQVIFQWCLKIESSQTFIFDSLLGNHNIVTLLLKQGAKPDALNPFGEPDTPSPLHLAILKGDPYLVKLLLDHDADPNRSTNIIGSPLHVACTDQIPNRIDIMKVELKRNQFLSQISNKIFTKCFRFS